MNAGRSYSLSGTRSSDRWDWRPGSFDRLNLRHIFPSENEWGIPSLARTYTIPSSLAAWHDITGIKKNPASFVHFFLDDYHFESVWNKPERSIEKISLAAGALSPDFSVLTGMPRATQLYQVYRSCWMGCLWQGAGIDVIPTAQWAEPETFSFCFAGLPEHGPVAVSAVGVRPNEVAEFDRGLRELVTRCQPSHLIVYGKLPGYVPSVDVIYYPTHWQKRGE